MPNRSITRPPGPEPHFLIGNFPLGSPDPLAVFSGWAREFGDIFYYRAGWIHVYFLNSPELIESVLVTNQQNFRKDRVIQNSRWFLGQGLLTSEGSEWLAGCASLHFIANGSRCMRGLSTGAPRKCWIPGKTAKTATSIRR